MWCLLPHRTGWMRAMLRDSGLGISWRCCLSVSPVKAGPILAGNASCIFGSGLLAMAAQSRCPGCGGGGVGWGKDLIC